MPSTKEPSRRTIGRFLRVSATILALVGLPILFILAGLAAETLSPEVQVIVAVGLIVVAVGVVLYVRWLQNYASRHMMPSGQESLASDRRAPVVYLRSFEEEERVSDEEQALARVVADFGPFVAIGRPGETLPPLGASRFYERQFREEGYDWQSLVLDLIKKAAVVFVAPAGTSGLRWEIGQCRRMIAPRRLFVLVTREEAPFQDFRNGTAASVGLELPPFPTEHAQAFDSDDLIGVVRFSDDWSSHFQPFPLRKPQISDVDQVDQKEARLRAGLHDVLTSAGVMVQPSGHRYRYAAWLGWALYTTVVIVAVSTWLWFR